MLAAFWKSWNCFLSGNQPLHRRPGLFRGQDLRCRGLDSRQKTYREISSCSNCGDFQARRANIKYKPKGRQGGLSAYPERLRLLPAGRTMAAIIENGQQADGSIVLPRPSAPIWAALRSLNPQGQKNNWRPSLPFLTIDTILFGLLMANKFFHRKIQ